MKSTENKKILNASPTEYNGVSFRSRLECNIYKYLLSININPQYEIEKICIWNRNSFNVPYYDRYGKTFQKITRKPTSVHYTPDFIFYYNNTKVYLEVKGFKNDVTPYKIRLFRDWLEAQPNTDNLCYAVIYSIKDLKILLKDLQN